MDIEPGVFYSNESAFIDDVRDEFNHPSLLEETVDNIDNVPWSQETDNEMNDYG